MLTADYVILFVRFLEYTFLMIMQHAVIFHELLILGKSRAGPTPSPEIDNRLGQQISNESNRFDYYIIQYTEIDVYCSMYEKKNINY